jgi:nicotinamidase/pyrazinamidase
MHPDKTAHFSDTPNFVDSWPPHCRKDTPGAAFHPELLAGGNVAAHFIKGDVAAATPAEDNSYTGALAHRYYPLSDRDVLLPEYLRNEGVDVVYLGGLALGDGKDHPLCVDSTAIDLKQAGFKVIVITDAVEAVNPDNREICFANLGAIGVQLATTSEIIADIR